VTAATALAPGTRLAHYVLGRPLGTGGMGTVYEAHDTALDRTVALKVLDPRLAEDGSVVARFEREARAAARRNHPNLAHIYFVGAEDGLHYFAMEHVPGRNLEAHVAEEGPQSLAFAVDAIVQAARGLAAAHRAGVVHRDVKPSNLMLTPEGDVKVTDFGLAKSLGGDPRITGAGHVMGTPLFMSPEACREQPTDARSDIYSLGLTAWFLLAGRPAYSGASLASTMVAQLHEPLPSLAEPRPDLPREVDETLARLCAKDPAARPESMDEVVRLFEALRPRVLQPAPFAARAAALAIDLLCVGTVEAAAIFVVWQELGWHTFENWIDEVALTLGGFAFLLFVEARWGASLGKRALHLRVVGEGGVPVRFVTHATRFVVRFPVLLLPTPPSSDTTWLVSAWSIQAVAFFVGAIWFAASRGRTLSDAVTGTRVVYDLPEPHGRGGI
jgi:uncharacterized RDD family membrane protein YckC